MGSLGTSALFPSSTLSCPREDAWFPPSPGQRLQGHVLSVKSLWGFTHSFILKCGHYPPCFLCSCQQHIILPPSATRAATPTGPEPAFPVTRKKSVGAREWQQLFWESVLGGWQIPPFLHGAQASWRRARAVFLLWSFWQPSIPHKTHVVIHSFTHTFFFSTYLLSACYVPGSGTSNSLWELLAWSCNTDTNEKFEL